MDTILHLMPLWMFFALGLLLFTGYPVAFVLGGVGLAFALIGDMVGMFRLQQLSLITLRIYGSTMESPVLVAIPMFIFMGTMLEKSGVARDLLNTLQILLRRVPGGLALSVTLMGTIMAATTGIIGASVVMITLMALPVMIERRYDLPERVLPAAVHAAEAPTGEEAIAGLLEISARAHGVGTERCLRDYFRLPARESKRAVEKLAAEGRLLPVEVEGFAAPAWLHPEARRPRKVGTRALLAPFDPLIFERRRLEELFGFHYRIEIYTPKEKRRHGYYVLPFLLDEQIAGRVDLKSDRDGSALLVQAAWVEPDAPAHTATELAAELRLMAGWLGLETVEVKPRGDLASDLKAVL